MGSTTAKALRYGPCVTRGSHSFTCHAHTNHTCLYSPTARHHRPVAGTHWSLSADIHVPSEGFSICCYWFTRVILFSFIRYLLHVCYFYCLKLYHFYCKFFCSFIFFCSCLRVSCGVFKICVHLQLLSDTYTDLFDECNYSVCCTLNHRPQSLYVCGPDNSQLINFYKSL